MDSHNYLIAVIGGIFAILQAVILKRQEVIHVLVNSKMSDALAEIESLKAEVRALKEQKEKCTCV